MAGRTLGFKSAIASIFLFNVIVLNNFARSQNPSDAPKNDASTRPANAVDPKSLEYAEIGSNASGCAIYSMKPQKGARAALSAAMADVDKILGAHPKITGAFVNKNDYGGGSDFTADVNGKSVSGSVMVGIGPNGAAVSILYANADARASDRAQLLADLPATIKLTTTPFGDGVGEIGVPDGWKIKSSDNTGAVSLSGPDDEQVTIGNYFLMLAPGSPPAQQQMQSEQLARQFGHQPILGRPIAQFGPPVDALKGIFPWFSNISVSHGGPSQKIKEIIATKEQKTDVPNNDMAVIYYRSTINTPGKPTDRRALAQITTSKLSPQLQGEWGLYINAVSAPEANFDRQLPTMLAVWNSYHPDVKKAIAHAHANTVAIQSTFKAAIKNMKAIEDSTDRMMADERERELASERSNADVDEVIRGYRAVEDTQTGQRRDVNLADSRAIVEKLNEGDPGRFVEIPLRDGVDPF